MALPLGLRNWLAELILDGFDDRSARQTLEALVAVCRSPDGRVGAEATARLCDAEWFEPHAGNRVRLVGGHMAHRGGLRRRAEAALQIFRGHPTLPDGETLSGLLGQAALLADARLFFEVHELLEPAWIRADGVLRVALQGLIQVAVALHHADHGNHEGATSLLTEGLAKLGTARSALPLKTSAWEAGLRHVLTTLRAGAPCPPMPPWPHPPAGSATESAWRSS